MSRKEPDDLKKYEPTPERAARMNVALFQFMGAISALTFERGADEPDPSSLAMHEHNQRAAYNELRWFAHDVGQTITAQVADGVYLRIDPFPKGTRRVVDIPDVAPRPTIAAAFLDVGNAPPDEEYEIPEGWMVFSDGYVYPTTLECPWCEVAIDATTIGVERNLIGSLPNDPMQDPNTAAGRRLCPMCHGEYRVRWCPRDLFAEAVRSSVIRFGS